MPHEDFSKDILEILKKEKADFRFFEHEPVFTKEEILALADRFDFRGEEMKNLLLCDKKSRHFYLAITLAKKDRVDLEKIAKIVNENKLKLASKERIQEITKAVPGCVSPFGFNDTISTIVDEAIFESEFLLFSAGAPNNTVEVSSKDLRKIFENLPNRVIFISL